VGWSRKKKKNTLSDHGTRRSGGGREVAAERLDCQFELSKRGTEVEVRRASRRAEYHQRKKGWRDIALR